MRRIIITLALLAFSLPLCAATKERAVSHDIAQYRMRIACTMAWTHYTDYAAVETYVAAHQPAPALLMRSIDTYNANRLLLTVIHDDFDCSVPPTLADQLGERDATDIFMAVTVLDTAYNIGIHTP